MTEISSPPSSLVAIVEDDAAVLMSLQFALEARGHAVRTFEGVAAALRSEEINDADCLVIDYALPDGDGVSLLHALRDRGATGAAIFIAGNPTVRCQREVEACGAPLLEKPLIADLLVEYIRLALESA